MTRTEVRTFLNDGVDAVNDSIPFGSGRVSEWNSNRTNEYPGVWWESVAPLNTEILNFSLPSDAWPIKLWIGKKDSADSSAVAYELLIDECDSIAQKLIRQYNTILEGANANMTAIVGINREPFVKRHADLITGVILSFSLNVPDTTNLC